MFIALTWVPPEEECVVRLACFLGVGLENDLLLVERDYMDVVYNAPYIESLVASEGGCSASPNATKT